MNSEQQGSWRRHTVFDSMNAHSQADDPALTYVMQFNADEQETAAQANALDPADVVHISRAILILRGRRVLLDTELAALYAVSTKRFNEQVRRNLERFPEDFMFQLTAVELASLRSQNATSKVAPQGRGGRRYLPYAFTEHGAIMAATILNSPRAVEMSVYVVRAFVHLRELLSSNRELARRFAQLETRLDKRLVDHDRAIAAILSAIRELMHPPVPDCRPIGLPPTSRRSRNIAAATAHQGENDGSVCGGALRARGEAPQG